MALPANAQEIVDRIDDAIVTVSGPITNNQARQGWTRANQADMTQLLQDWKASILRDGQLLPKHFGMFRWFFDHDVGQSHRNKPTDPWEELILGIDHDIHEMTIGHQHPSG